MTNRNDLPLGIRNNNPGNMRRGRIHEIPFKVVRGFAVFRTPADGLTNLADWIASHLAVPHKVTIYDLVSIYAPPSENDTSLYARVLAQWCKLPLGSEKTRDIRHMHRWAQLDMMRGIIHMECGNPPSKLSVGGEWFSPSELWDAFERREALR